MKKIIYLIAISVIFACTSENEKKDLKQSDVLTEFTNTRIQNFEASLIKSLSTNTDIELFQKSLKEDLIKTEAPLMVDIVQKMSKYNKVKSTYNPEGDTVLINKMNDLKIKVLVFTPNQTDDDETIKQKFLSHLNNEKNLFVESVNSQNDLSETQKDILINQAIYELGVISVLSKHSESLEQLSNGQQNIKGFQKVSNVCNWWCRNSKAIVCSGMSLGAAGCWVGVVYGCVPCVEYCAALTVASVACWNK